MLCVTNVNVNAPLTHIYDFCEVIFADKARPVINIFDKSRACTNDPNSMALSVVKCLFFVIVPIAGSDTIFDTYTSVC